MLSKRGKGMDQFKAIAYMLIAYMLLFSGFSLLYWASLWVKETFGQKTNLTSQRKEERL